MARTVNFKGNPVRIQGEPGDIGSAMPGFTGTGTDLGEIKLADYLGKVVLVSTVPSIDTGVCDLQTKRFNKAAADNDFVVLTVSRDLPFAMKRWCGATDSDAVVCVSDFRDQSIGKTLGLEMLDGPLKALLARSVTVLNANGKIVYHELVPEITREPDYDAAIAAAKEAAG